MGKFVDQQIEIFKNEPKIAKKFEENEYILNLWIIYIFDL